ncbi:hypothetical protein HpDR134_09530 [Helicobacter pylori]|uniref:hypothetical protein n=1 Tax=Helicobacter pylori TaxID=210 RepID=UPI00026AEBB0|nr:hypothetical protein [Helicobacter pylori]EJB89094.1 hypothetical protein HPHPH19_1566 [Helicobacter pylori Hp H-19]
MTTQKKILLLFLGSLLLSLWRLIVGLKINLAIFDKKGLDGLIALCLFMFASFFTLILLHSLYRFVKDIANSNQNFNKTNSKEYTVSIVLLIVIFITVAVVVGIKTYKN